MMTKSCGKIKTMPYSHQFSTQISYRIHLRTDYFGIVAAKFSKKGKG